MKKDRRGAAFAGFAVGVGVGLAIALLAFIFASMSIMVWPAGAARHARLHDRGAVDSGGFVASGGWGSDGNPHELRVELDGSVVCSRK